MEVSVSSSKEKRGVVSASYPAPACLPGSWAYETELNNGRGVREQEWEENINRGAYLRGGWKKRNRGEGITLKPVGKRSSLSKG